MRKLLIALMMTAPVLCFAQNWETVQPTIQTEKKSEKKDTQKPSKADKESMRYEQDKPYLAGAVPEISGKVIYDMSLDLPGKSAQEIYDSTFAFLQKLTQGENSLPDSKIALIDKTSKSIVAQYEEWMIFSKKLLELDRAVFNYVIEVQCEDGRLDFKVSRLRYAFEVDRPTGFRAHAEDLITDKYMLSKDGRSLKKQHAKFRCKTVDRMNEIRAALCAEVRG